MSNLLNELEVKNLKLEQLKNKEEYLHGKLEVVEQRFTELNDSMINQAKQNFLEDKDSASEKLLKELKEANVKIDGLQKRLYQFEKEIEISKLKEYTYVRQVESMSKQIEELDVQLSSYKHGAKVVLHPQKTDEPGALEISFKSLDSYKVEQPSFMGAQRKSSMVLKKKYEIKATHFKPIKTVEKSFVDRSMLRYEDMKSIIVKKRKVSFIEEPKDEIINKFSGYCYFCHVDHKILKVIVYHDNVIYIVNLKGKKPLYEIPILNIKQFVCSTTNSFLYQLNFLNDSTGEKEEIVLEIPNGLSFFKAVQTSLYFDPETVRVKYLNIESNLNFNNASLNLFSSAKKATLLETWLNSLSTSWDFNFFILLDSVLLKIKAPSMFYYVDYQKLMRRPYIYFLENYNVIKDEKKIGLARSNIFALKIQNEKKDIIFACLMEEEKEAWVKALG